MTRTDLCAAIERDLQDRTSWESKQGDLYKARYRGLRRSNPPWPNASDINWPLIDGVIERLKPAFLQQLYATELIATFAPAVTDPEILQFCGVAAQWFDWELKQNSNFELSLLHVIDWLLMLGRPAMKVAYDVDRKRLEFSAVSPEKLIVPADVESLDCADRIVHVIEYRPEVFRALSSADWRNDEDTIKAITTSGTEQESGGNSVKTALKRRVGISEPTEGKVIVWEVWTKDGDKWVRETFAPTRPEIDLRPTATDPLGKVGHPFVDFPYEITQPDWHSPRGVGEIVLTFQAELTKLLNEKNDAMTLGNRPLFSAERDGVESNLRWRPGQILPVGVRPMPMAPPPISFDVQINLMRQVAEQLVGTPDFGMAREGDMRKARTATEMEMVASMNSQSGDLRMRIFRMNLGRLFAKAWLTLQENSKGSAKYWRDTTVEEITENKIQAKYLIRPSGSADGVTRQRLWQKAVARLQMFANDPFVDQGELRKSVLEADDTGLVRRLFRDPQLRVATEAEDQAAEIAIMRIGFPAVVTPADDHATHIRTLLLYVQQQSQTGIQPEPMEAQHIAQHLEAHLAALETADPKQGRAARDAVAVVMQGITGAGGQGQPQMASQEVMP